MLTKIRDILKINNADFALILTADYHLSEYIPEYFKLREFISGFSGSAGSLLISLDDAILFTDGRYFLQAENELKDSIRLIKSPDYIDYIKNNLSTKKALIDLKTISQNNYEKLKNLVNIIDYDNFYKDFYDKKLPQEPIYKQNEKFISDLSANKIKKVQDELKNKNIDYCVISSLSDIAYLTNYRGKDVEFNPVFLSYMIISQTNAICYIEPTKLKNIQKDLNIIYKNYDEFYSDLSSLSGNVLCDFANTNAKIISLINANLVNEILPSTIHKACKNDIEIKHIKQAHIIDAIALTKFNYYLEYTNLDLVDELKIDEVLTQFRQENEYFISNSFDTIAAFNENAAIIHYKANAKTSKLLNKSGLLLLDSGAQYECGTTDITRVFKIKNASLEQIRDYTLVLKAHIAISKTIAPENIKMPLLDSIARKELWQYGFDYLHGTGHGVGYFLNVHEGPQVLSLNANISEHTKLKRGMLTSIEPGLYHNNKYGIRLENLAISKHCFSSEYGDFLSFDIVTLYPFELDLIDKKLLNQDEINWLNDYHKKVFDTISVFLDDELKQFLEFKTRALN